MGQKEIEGTLINRIKSDISRSPNIKKIDDIVFESFDIDTWGDMPIYKVDGYVECRVKTGVFSTEQGKKGFSAKVDARNGKILAFNWRLGEPLK